MRETVLQGITVPPPNSYGTARQTNALVNGYSYARWRTPATGGPFSMVRIYVRVNGTGKVIVGITGFNPIDASQFKKWLDIRRAGEPACKIWRNFDTDLQVGALGIYADIPFGGKMIEYPITLSIDNGIMVQSVRGAAALQVTFYWFEP